jgi:hypothetical protein
LFRDGLPEVFIHGFQQAADISPMIVLKGVFVSFYTTFFGLGIFLVSYIIWYLLKVIWMKERD